MNSVSDKTCTRCQVEKSLSEFTKNKNSKDGLSHSCKSCRAEYGRANRQRISEYERQYRLANKDRTESVALEYRRRNNKQRREATKQWRENNPDKHLAYKQKWNQEHPEKVSLHRTNRRVRMKGTRVFYIRSKFFIRLYSSACVVCGEKENINADHVIPLYRGGTHSEGNLQPLCGYCNSSKGAKLMVEFRQSRPDLFS